jgi:sulfonate transport system substrate-binding protein
VRSGSATRASRRSRARPARSPPTHLKAKGKKINVAYVYDTARGIKLFADQAFFTVSGDKSAIAPFLLKKDAEAHAAKVGGKVVTFTDALKSAVSGG